MRPPPGDLVGTHIIVSRQRGWGGTPNVFHLMGRDWDLLLLSVAAAGMVMLGVRRDALVPVLWFVVAAVAVQFHEPAWYHHSLLLTLPAAWAAAVVIDELLRQRARVRSRALTLALVGFCVWQGAKLAVSVGRMFVPDDAQDRQVVEELRRRAPATRWVVADRLIYPFAAGLVVPPELAVVSVKRLESGKLPGTLVVDVLERYRPEQIVLSRVDLGARVRDHVRSEYRPVWERDDAGPLRLYVRKDLK